MMPPVWLMLIIGAVAAISIILILFGEDAQAIAAGWNMLLLIFGSALLVAFTMWGYPLLAKVFPYLAKLLAAIL